MGYFTERNGMRKSIEKTSEISVDAYYLLYNVCVKYKSNLIHLFPQKCYDNFLNKEYIEFNQKIFSSTIKLKIPDIFQDDYGNITVPTEEDCYSYNQYSLLDLIEFFAQNIKDISESWNNERYKNYKVIDCFESDEVFTQFQNEINEILTQVGLLYVLTEGKIIERTVENFVLINEIEQEIPKLSEKSLQALLNIAIPLYKSPNPVDNKLAVEKIWDALENLEKYFKDSDKKQARQKIADILGGKNPSISKIFEDELSCLGKIGNTCEIRHYNEGQQQIVDDSHYDYFFNRCLSLIALAIQYLK